MGKSDDDKLDKLMGEMGKRKKIEENLGNLVRDTTGHELKIIRKQAIVELMEKVEACESEEEGNALMQKFFKDALDGKLTPCE